MRRSLSNSFTLMIALGGGLWMAGCTASPPNQPNSSGNPTDMGATPSPAADQRTDAGLHNVNSPPGSSSGDTTNTGASGSK